MYPLKEVVFKDISCSSCLYLIHLERASKFKVLFESHLRARFATIFQNNSFLQSLQPSHPCFHLRRHQSSGGRIYHRLRSDPSSIPSCCTFLSEGIRLRTPPVRATDCLRHGPPQKFSHWKDASAAAMGGGSDKSGAKLSAHKF